MLGFARQVRAELGYTIEELNLGGGFGIRYGGMIPRHWKAIWRRSPRWCWFLRNKQLSGAVYLH